MKKTQNLFSYFKNDFYAGFLVFLLALPLSLGIAKASGFPAAMGIFTAMVGGLITSLFSRVSPLSIKGPAAGLITICAAAINEVSAIDHPANAISHLSAILLIVSALQIFVGYMRLGSLAELFPHSAIHGMLAAIGIIIIAKQIPVLLGDDPLTYKGEGSIQLIKDIPKFIQNAHPHIAKIGVIGLIVLFAIPLLPYNPLKKIPPPMIVLLLTVPLGWVWHLKTEEPSYALVRIGDFWSSIHWAPNFTLIGAWVFWKYVFMFLFVNSLESLLTVKAIDNLDPLNRKTNPNSDLKALGVGNGISAIFGGLPMISEVVRSSANIGFGGKSRAANFFHGVFLLISMLLLIPAIEMIPNAALAALLIFAGFRLASPKEFIKTYHLGKEQLAIFLITIFVTLFSDLLLGVASGILVKLTFHLFSGVPLISLFTSKREIIENDSTTIRIKIFESAVFTNILTFKGIFDGIDSKKNIIVDFSHCMLVDNPFMEYINQLKTQKEEGGVQFTVMGLEEMIPFSKHPLATRRRNIKF